ncbi:hypothetical protein chiPu_0025543, partial [Chiloscyllium punctatum]|nr:hypothetical protein [Chiloscyllium punctatum]
RAGNRTAAGIQDQESDGKGDLDEDAVEAKAGIETVNQ